MKRGLFGGSFDPIHLGHLRSAEEIRELFELETILFVPAGQQPLKADRQALEFRHRAAMVRLAIADNPAFQISEMEHRRGGKSYSVDTVGEFLAEQDRELELYFILGQDAFRDIALWKNWQELLRLCHLIVMTRPGFDPVDPVDILPPQEAGSYIFEESERCFRGKNGKGIYLKRLTGFEISSTDIRNRRSRGRSIRYLVPDSVRTYIESEGLYRRAGE